MKSWFEVMGMVTGEIKRAEQQHPTWPDTLLHQVMIVSEEMGEVQKAALTYTEYMSDASDPPHPIEATRLYQDIDDEMAQVAAMAIRFLMNR